MVEAVDGEDLLFVAILQNPVDLSGSSGFRGQGNRSSLLHLQVGLGDRELVPVLNQWSNQ